MVNVVNLIGAAVSAPTGVWETILNWLESGIINYGWVIIVFTILIKLCLSPLDLLMKFNSKKSSLVQQKLAPQIARINQKYQNDKNTAQMQTNALYKKEGYNVFVSCILMIVNMAITMTVFFTLFSSLREMSAYKAINQYSAIQDTYITTLANETKPKFITALDSYEFVYQTEYEKNEDGTVNKDENGKPIITITSFNRISNPRYEGYKTKFEGDPAVEGDVGIFENMYSLEGTLTEEQVQFLYSTFVVFDETEKTGTSLASLYEAVQISSESAAVEATKETWNKVKDDWLWVGNIWVADNYKSPLPSYDDLLSMAKSSKNNEYQKYVQSIDKTLYNNVTSSVSKSLDRWNGYFILAILAGVTSFLSQYISELTNKSKNKQVNKMVDNANPNNNATMKIMKFVLPAMMVVFVITSSAAFSLYIVISSIISMAISAITSLIVNACYKKKEQEVMEFLEKEVARSIKKSKRQEGGK